MSSAVAGALKARLLKFANPAIQGVAGGDLLL